MQCDYTFPKCKEGQEFMGKKDITDCIEAFAVVYSDGEVGGVYSSEGHANRTHVGVDYKLVRLVPADQVIIDA